MRQEQTDVEEVWDRYAVRQLSLLQPISSSVVASQIRRGRLIAGCARELDEQCLLSDAAVVTFRLERPLIKMSGHLSVSASSTSPRRRANRHKAGRFTSDRHEPPESATPFSGSSSRSSSQAGQREGNFSTLFRS